ncbi:MAG: 3-deoxy-7-phosphoheptulonate synthase [Lentisphaeria bacterium]|nr:3-deoxy-7-phosphoheptulonate synthase [Lentisphaeria bacterium]NQZ68166.1 3-deoxy-7-phosphoheptulonate synthase [Lentisphaeria bacterium]
MIIVCNKLCTDEDIDFIQKKAVEYGYEPRLIRGVERTIIACIGDEIEHPNLMSLVSLKCIDSVMPIQKRYKLASREFHATDSEYEFSGAKLGNKHFLTIAGPCSVESIEQMHAVSKDLVAAGIKVMRGGVYKPRTSPYDFQGMGDEGLEILQEMKNTYGFAIATEVLGEEQIEKAAKVADILQIGARNCQNYHLLKKVSHAGRAVLLKRGMATTVEEWLLAAEYLLVNGCEEVILCERGIRTYEKTTRFTLDVAAIAAAKKETHLPVIVDPSHPAGQLDFVMPLAKAGIAAGADGMIIETHPKPSEACSDAAQQIPSNEFKDFLKDLQPLIELMVKE